MDVMCLGQVHPQLHPSRSFLLPLLLFAPNLMCFFFFSLMENQQTKTCQYRDIYWNMGIIPEN